MYAKLVLKNAKRSVKEYLVYLVTMTICVTLFYSFLSISSRYYHPDVGSEYNFRILGRGMKYAICAVTLLLLFLIRYVNHYMLRSRQKEFALQAVMGMEQKTIGRIFFAETFIMGICAIAAGIFFGVFGSQFITAMVLTSYEKSYRISWTLFPDTVLLTIGFFVLSFIVVGLFNLRTVRKIKIIDMLSADKKNEPSLKKSRWMPTVIILYELSAAGMLANGIQTMYYYFDRRFAIPVHIMFWGNILLPAAMLLWSVGWLIAIWAGRKKCDHKQAVANQAGSGTDGQKNSFSTLITGLLVCSILNAFCAASMPGMQNKYYLSFGTGINNQYMMSVLVDLLFLICAVIYLANSFIIAWKEKSPEHRYHGQNLFFYGQITTKLSTTNKTMTLICATLAMAIFLFMIAPVLIGWAGGYLDVRSKYDVQIFSRYNNVYEEENLPRDDYEFVADYLAENGVETAYDITFDLYLPRSEDFHKRIKYDFPVVAISLSDYNVIRQMLGYEQISLEENEFTTQWQTIATEDERDDFLKTHGEISTDAGKLTLAKRNCYTEAMGETLYNSYTDAVLVFPDSVCRKLLPVMRNRYIITTDKISYEKAYELEELFVSVYPENTESGVAYGIGLSTLQINRTKADMFVLQAVMLYGAVILMVICLTILSLQQLLDAGHYRYRFAVLRKLGVEEKDVEHLILKQLGVWFGLPVIVAILVSAVIATYFIQSVSAQISAYIGFGTLMMQILVTGGVLVLLLLCYFISTWILFKSSVGE
ncbi:MAG: ABC transporter permease [Lachnospiraceae bacterium]|nr:ABC transporter permease [Lachnospiraceae bacterium]